MTTFGDMVSDLTFSPDGSRIAALGKEDGKWSVFVDDKAWSGRYDTMWPPVFSPDGSNVGAKFKQGKTYGFAINGKEYSRNFDAVWDPVFSPDSKMVMLRCVREGKYHRTVMPVAEITG